MAAESRKETSVLDNKIKSILPELNLETILILLILIVAVISRFAFLGERVMSHDEVNHVVPSWELYQGQVYIHNPMTHGPLQFHLLAFSYYLFGDNDFSSRIPAAIFSIATVAAVIFLFRRYLGRIGSLIAGLLFLISPYILFYGRYTRNEVFIGLFAVVMFYAIFRYFEKKDHFSLLLLAITTSLNYCTKETAYIYSAQLLLFLAFYLIWQMMRNQWIHKNMKTVFQVSMIVLIVMLVGVLGVKIFLSGPTSGDVMAAQEEIAATNPTSFDQILFYLFIFGAAASGVMMIFSAIKGYGLERIRSFPVFDLLFLSGTLIIPLLSAFPIVLLGWNPEDYTMIGIVRSLSIILVLLVISGILGYWWKGKTWFVYAAVFYAIFAVFYTTFFNNGQGLISGFVGGLGYWLGQQEFERGSQPWYYYAFFQVPLYEYLAAVGTLIAVFFAVKYRKFITLAGLNQSDLPGNDLEMGKDNLADADPETENEKLVDYYMDAAISEKAPDVEHSVSDSKPRIPVIAFLLFWAVSAVIAYTIAGEKMPWLTFHIAIPMLLASGWGIGYLVEQIDWKKLFANKGLLIVLLSIVFMVSVSGMLGSLVNSPQPFSGNTTTELNATTTFLFALIFAAASGGLVFWLLRDWNSRMIIQLLVMSILILLMFTTTRTSYAASFINYDYATEYLVYAHAARGPKDALEQIEELSMRITGGKDIKVAYDNNMLYPYWWYLRNYPNHMYYGVEPSRDLRDYPLIVVSDKQYTQIEKIVQDNYIYFEYMRLWWPNMDYFNLTWDRLIGAFTDPEVRAGIFQIWLDKDYTTYGNAAATSSSELFTLENWEPSEQFRLYIRKDIIQDIWEYGNIPEVPELMNVYPYEVNRLEGVLPDLVVGSEGVLEGQFMAPRDIAAAPDGSIYVADSQNHRIQHISAEGELLHVWGMQGAVDTGISEGGYFNEPWGIAVDNDGYVYVADTWNHRIQKFTSTGEFVTMWGEFGQGMDPYVFYGPRDIAVDSQNHIYVTDTGNKRVVIFDSDGNYLSQFGGYGFEDGMFDEPVGIAIDQDGYVYVADTWNQRVQKFAPQSDGEYFTHLLSWDISAWYGQSLDNKPYLTAGPDGYIYVADPEGYQILQFDSNGTYIRAWGDYSISEDGFALAAAVAVDQQGHVWVTDAGNNRLLRYTLPEIQLIPESVEMDDADIPVEMDEADVPVE